MQFEISALFNLQEKSITKIHEIGDGVYFEKLDHNWITEVREQCPEVPAYELLYPPRTLTHRFTWKYTLPETGMASLQSLSEINSYGYKLIQRIIFLSRIIKPTSIGYTPLFVESGYSEPNLGQHKSFLIFNNLNIAIVNPEFDEVFNTYTDADAEEMTALWANFQIFFNGPGSHNPKYHRIFRAILQNEFSYATPFGELAHSTAHTALEVLICTTHKFNKKQIVGRLPQIIPTINGQDTEKIYKLCCEFKHAAAPWFLDALQPGGKLTPSDQERLDSVILLRQIIRKILRKAIEDISFADKLADPQILRTAFPVYNGNTLI
jgi:hypothetical protein